MDERILSCTDENGCTENACISTSQIYDTCRDKECLEDLRVCFTEEGQELIQNACSVKVNKAEIIWVFSDVEQLPFNRGYYTVDLQFYFRLEMSVFTGACKPTLVEGIATFNKKVVLFGSEGTAKIFQSRFTEDSFDAQMWKKTNMPRAVVEVVDPIALAVKMVDSCDCCCRDDCDISRVPRSVQKVFDGELCCKDDGKRVYVTLGIFVMVRLERDVQLSVPALSFCVPETACNSDTTTSDPCDLFDKLSFPVDEFFPPRKCDFDNYNQSLDNNPYTE